MHILEYKALLVSVRLVCTGIHSLGVTLVYPALDLFKEAAVGVAGRLVLLTLKDPGVMDGQLPTHTLALVLTINDH